MFLLRIERLFKHCCEHKHVLSKMESRNNTRYTKYTFFGKQKSYFTVKQFVVPKRLTLKSPQRRCCETRPYERRHKFSTTYAMPPRNNISLPRINAMKFANTKQRTDIQTGQSINSISLAVRN